MKNRKAVIVGFITLLSMLLATVLEWLKVIDVTSWF